MRNASAVVIGGTAGIGREVARQLSGRGEHVVISGRDAHRAELAAAEIGGNTSGIAVDLTAPDGIGPALSGVEHVDHVVITSAEDYVNSLEQFDVALGSRVATLKMIGYTEVIHTLRPRLGTHSSIVLFGGVAAIRPYPGSTMVTATNSGVAGLVRAFASELGSIRVNGIHPAAVGDTERWNEVDTRELVERTPIGRLVTIAEVVAGVLFLLDNTGVSGVNLTIDGGTLLR